MRFIATSALALVTIFSAMTATATNADARRWRGDRGAAIALGVASVIAGIAISRANRYSYYDDGYYDDDYYYAPRRYRSYYYGGYAPRTYYYGGYYPRHSYYGGYYPRSRAYAYGGHHRSFKGYRSRGYSKPSWSVKHRIHRGGSHFRHAGHRRR